MVLLPRPGHAPPSSVLPAAAPVALRSPREGVARAAAADGKAPPGRGGHTPPHVLRRRQIWGTRVRVRGQTGTGRPRCPREPSLLHMPNSGDVANRHVPPAYRMRTDHRSTGKAPKTPPDQPSEGHFRGETGVLVRACVPRLYSPARDGVASATEINPCLRPLHQGRSDFVHWRTHRERF